MCIFQSGKDIPPAVRISLRTLQYLVIPLLSLAILCVGSIHLGRCDAQPFLPVWHVVAGSSGLCTPVFYLLFDEVNPWMSRRLPWLSSFADNVVVFLLPLYIAFELGWLVTGSVWAFGTSGVADPSLCDHTIFVFSFVVVVNFWIHVLTPLVFMLVLCCTRLFPYCAYCTYWNVAKKVVDNWTRQTRMSLCCGVSVPLGAAMVIAGGLSVERCDSGAVHIPVWLVVSGAVLLLLPSVYWVYDRYCKEERAGPLIKSLANCLVVGYMMCALVWAVVGFVWVFGSHQSLSCGANSFTYQFAFATLIILNVLMDVWICYKICVVLHWAFLSDD